MSSKNRRAKIVCTIGPASSKPEMVERLVSAGMDVARLNFSHGAPAEHAQRVAAIRHASGVHEKPIAILGDLQGPKIRTGKLAGGGKINLSVGQKFVITTENVAGNVDGVSTTFQQLPHVVHRGDRILLSDGEIALRVQSTQGRKVITRVEDGGELGEHQGINLPGVKLQIPSLTPKDRKDLVFALSLGVNYLALSFVRSARDVNAAKAAVARAGKTTPVIAKLEKPEAIENLDEILSVADGVMVARGDLGVEMNPEQVPVVQKQIISRARNTLVPVITATQMLDSMTQNPRPTRAEASDVANAIFDGSDALMLSGETAVGRYPIESVEMMDRIIRVAEASSSARLVSKYRPRTEIIAFSPSQETRRRISLYWGVRPRSIVHLKNMDALVEAAEKRLIEEKLVHKGDVIGIISGTPLGATGTTNMMRLHRIGE